MGASSSTLEDDKALQLCRERKRFVRQALDGRCSLAAAHFTYIESLRNVGTALSNFVQPGANVESSAYNSMGMTPELHARNGKSNSQFSFSSSSFRHHVDAPETLQLTPSTSNPVQFQANYMKTSVSSSITVEEKPFPSARTVRSTPSTPPNETAQSTERPQTPEYEDFHIPPDDSPWDYFGLLHPIDRQFSFQEGNVENLRMENTDDFRRRRQEEGIPDLEEEKASLNEHIESEESEDEFEEPAADTLVQKFENRRAMDPQSPSTPSNVSTPKHIPLETSISSESKILNRGKSDSYIMQKTDLALTPAHEKVTPVEEPRSPNNAAPKDFVSSIKEIEHLFVMASDSGKEVPRMLEANKLHFRPLFTGKEGGSVTSTFLKACFSCGDDPTQAPEEPPPPVAATKYLTWHRTASSRSSSSRNPLGSAQKSDVDDVNNNIFENFYMNSGSHASTLDRLYAWERKLYDEVKDSTIIRREYDMKCRQLREQDSKGEIENTHRVDKTRATVKDLYSRIRVAIQRIDSISKRIEELRDKELQPQLEELIEGLNRMWEKMFECHKQQFNIIKVAYVNGTMKISIHSESHRQATMQLEYELKSFSSSFKEWIIAQKHYLQSINGWLHKCVSLQQKTSRRKRRIPDTPIRNLGPPIYVTCGEWLDKLELLPSKEVSDSVKALTIVTTHFLPRQDKKRGKNMKISLWMDSNRSEMEGILPRGESQEELDLGYDRFQASLVTFLDRLNSFSMFSVNMYREIQQAIGKAKEREMRKAH